MSPPIKLSDEAVDSLTSLILSRTPAKTINTFILDDKYTKYRGDPITFIETELGEELTDDLKKMALSVRDNQVTVAVSANGTGKSQPLSTGVMTPNGSKQMGDVIPGDMVIGQNGKPAKVKAIYPQGSQPTYEIFFNDRTSVFASEDHLWSVQSSSDQYRDRPYRTLTTLQIKQKIKQILHVPMCRAVEYSKKYLGIDPYVMGALLGDGCFKTNITLTSGDGWICDELQRRMGSYKLRDHKVQAQKCRCISFATDKGKPNFVRDVIRKYGLIEAGSYEKFIPDAYTRSCVIDRKALLAGLLDADGYIDTRHKISYATISPSLAKQVQSLVWSLGGTATIGRKKPYYKKNGKKIQGKTAYNLYIKVPFCPFLLPRKVRRYVPECEAQRKAQRVIKAVKYVGMMDSQCISVDNLDGLYLTENFTVTHNTWIAARLAVWFYLCFHDTKVFTAAAPPYDNLKNLLWGEIGSVIRDHPQLFAGHIVTSMDVRRGPEDYMIGVTIPSSGTEQEKEAKFSGKHQRHMLFAYDEGDAIPGPVYKGTESCMSGGFVRLLIMFNPRHAAGPVYRMIRDKTANVVHLSAFRHPNVITGKDLIPGAVSREVTVRRINEWTRPIRPGDKISERSVYTLPDFLVGAVGYSQAGKAYTPLVAGQYKIKNPSFSYMVLGRYPAQGSNQLISEEWVSAARARYDVYVAKYGEAPPHGAKGVMGLDVAEMGDDSNVACGRYGGYLSPFDTWGGIDTVETGDKAIQWYSDHQGIDRAMVDATGVGCGVAPHMQKYGEGVVATGIKVASKPIIKSELGDFRILRDELLWRVREWLRCDPGAMLPPDEDLLEELMVPTYDTDSGYVEVMKTSEMKELLARSPDHLMALAMTFAGAGGFFDGCDFQAFPEG